jgi:alpha-tubulin suppressor-like RCC1 family protein
VLLHSDTVGAGLDDPEMRILRSTQAIAASYPTGERTGDLKQLGETLSRLYAARAHALLEMGMLDRSLEDCRNAVYHHPKSPIGFYLLAKVLLRQNQLLESKEYIHRAMVLSENNNPDIEILRQEVEARILDDSSQAKAATVKTSVSHLTPTLYAWGFGECGQLGAGSTTNKMSASVVESFRGKTIVDIACGAVHSCAVVNEGEVFAWGDNSRLQLGSEHLATLSSLPQLIPSLVGTRIVAVSAGAAHTIALSDNGLVYGWGMCSSGQLGPFDGDSNGEFFLPRLICVGDESVISVACGLTHSVFLLSCGSISCCGANRFGQLGVPVTDQLFVTVPFKPLIPCSGAKITHIACGGAHTVIIDDNGTLFSCGSNSCGQLGLGDLIDVGQFTQISFGHAAESAQGAFVACGEEYTIVVSKNRSLYACGLNICGQLCLPSNVNPSVRCLKLVACMEGKRIESVSCGQGQVFALSDSGDVWTWGLPMDRANLIALSGEVIIREPEKLTDFGRAKRVQFLCCGRKHVLCSVYAPQGDLSSIIKGLPSADCSIDEEDVNSKATIGELKNGAAEITLYAGQRKVLIVQSRDGRCEICTRGGAQVLGSIESGDIFPPAVKHRLERMTLSPEIVEQALAPKAIIDDNMDGTYDCTLKMYLVGSYRLSLYLNGLEIAGSPWSIVVAPAKVFPARCTAWWGKYAQDSSDPLSLACSPRTAMSFTVSLRDAFANKVTGHADNCIVVKISGVDDDREIGEASNFSKGSSGIIPCYCTAPPEPGEYRVLVGINSIAKAECNVEGSPFSLVVSSTQLSEPSLPPVAAEASICGSPADEVNSPLYTMLVDTENTVTTELTKLCRAEMTRKRAEDALKKEQTKLALERAEKRRQKAVRRTGGGFIIQYSKDC